MKYFAGLLILIAALITMVVILFRDESKNTTAKVNEQPVLIADYFNSDVKLRVTMDGDVRARENKRAIRITVGRGFRQVEVLRGFTYEVINSKTYDNTQPDFEAFATALQKRGFTKPVKNAHKQPTDEVSVCATGTRYIYEVIEGSSQVTRLWSNTCVPEVGTFAGTGPGVRNLFQLQIPDYAVITKDVVLAPPAN